MTNVSANGAKHNGYTSGNLLLDALPPQDRADLEADLEFVPLLAHKYTHSTAALMKYVYFPIDAVLSVVATLENGDTIVVGTVGRESFVESDGVLNSPLSQRTSFCQVPGMVGRMSIQRFEARMKGNQSFAQTMHSNVRASLFSAQQIAACNSKHSVQQRCAGWLSMTEDRVGGAEFAVTHEFLAITLGVRRASVSQAAEALQKMGAIAYRHGRVKVLDRARLNSIACECYTACKLAFEASLQ